MVNAVPVDRVSTMDTLDMLVLNHHTTSDNSKENKNSSTNHSRPRRTIVMDAIHEDGDVEQQIEAIQPTEESGKVSLSVTGFAAASRAFSIGMHARNASRAKPPSLPCETKSVDNTGAAATLAMPLAHQVSSTSAASLASIELDFSLPATSPITKEVIGFDNNAGEPDQMARAPKTIESSYQDNDDSSAIYGDWPPALLDLALYVDDDEHGVEAMEVPPSPTKETLRCWVDEEDEVEYVPSQTDEKMKKRRLRKPPEVVDGLYEDPYHRRRRWRMIACATLVVCVVGLAAVISLSLARQPDNNRSTGAAAIGSGVDGSASNIGNIVNDEDTTFPATNAPITAAPVTSSPSVSPSLGPSSIPTGIESSSPTTSAPSVVPTHLPTSLPSWVPSVSPTSTPTDVRRIFTTRADLQQAILEYQVGDHPVMNDWDVSHVTDFSGLFAGRESGWNEPIGRWNVSKGVSFARMFEDAHRFDQDLSQWDLSNAQDLSWMFFGASQFHQDVALWHVHRVTSMAYMFYGARRFNHNLAAWDLQSVNELQGMFQGISPEHPNHFDQNLCPWREFLFPDGEELEINVMNLFSNTRCPRTSSPGSTHKVTLCHKCEDRPGNP